MGKTRLADELIAAASDRWTVLAGRGYRMEQDLPYGVVTQLLRPAIERIEEAGLPAWVIGELARLLPGLGRAGIADPYGESRLLEAIHAAVGALAAGRPLLIVVDDAHWADSSSAAVLAFVARRTKGLPVLVLVLAREGEAPPAELADLMSTADVRISLQPLTVTQLLPLVGNDATAARDLELRTGGIPLLAAEALASGDGTSTPGLTRYLETRWNELGDLERQLLTAAAVLGGTCDPGLLRDTSGRSEEEVVEGVERLTALGLLRETADGIGFTLDAMERLAYESASLVRRRLLHGRAGDALAARPDVQRDVAAAASVAAQYQAAARPEAATWYLLAGDLARAVYAHDMARHFYESALALGTNRVAEARLAIAELDMAAGRYEEARRQLTLAGPSAGDLSGVILHRLGDVERLLGRFDSAEDLYRSALDSGAAEVALFSDWALLAMRTGRQAVAVELAERARASAEEGGSDLERSRVRSILAAVTTDPGTALAHAEAAAELAGEDEVLLMAALNSQALVLAERGDHDRAGTVLEQAIAIAQRTGHRHREAALWSHLGDIHHRAGREDEARRAQTRAVSMFADIDAGGFEPELWLLTRW